MSSEKVGLEVTSVLEEARGSYMHDMTFAQRTCFYWLKNENSLGIPLNGFQARTLGFSGDPWVTIPSSSCFIVPRLSDLDTESIVEK